MSNNNELRNIIYLENEGDNSEIFNLEKNDEDKKYKSELKKYNLYDKFNVFCENKNNHKHDN